MSSRLYHTKPFEYGVLKVNALAAEFDLTGRGSQRTLLMGTIVKLESVQSVQTYLVKFLEEDGETWESTKFAVEKYVVIEVSVDFWPFLAAVTSPQARVKLADDKRTSRMLMEVSVDSTVGFSNFGTVVLASVKYIGKIKRMGKGYGLLLHEKCSNSNCDGALGEVRYFKCRPGYAAFATVDHIVPYAMLYGKNEEIIPTQLTSGAELNRELDKNLESFSITKLNNCDVRTSTIKNSGKPKTQPVGTSSLRKDKQANNVKVSSSLLDLVHKTSNQNNDFDHNTIIQPENIRLMKYDLKTVQKEQKCDMDCNTIFNEDQDGVKTLKKPGDKSQKSVFYTACPELHHNDVASQTRNKSTNLINHLVNSKTIPRRNRALSPQSNFYVSQNEELDIKSTDTNAEINRSSYEDKTALPPPVQYATPMPGTTNDLTIGSLVEISNDVSTEPLYGVVRWLGIDSSNQVLVGVELEDENSHLPLTLTDGTHNGERYFKCSKSKAIFVPLHQCHKDSRFTDGTSIVAQTAPEQTFGKEMESPIIKGSVPPLCMTTEEDVEAVCGKFRGIQGHHNSCYLDATLFAMFTFTSVFDTLLFRPRGRDDIQSYEKVQQVLREEIVNPLRTNLFVRADRVMNLRQLLDQLSSVSGLTTEEKDPEEFLHSLLAQILKAEPFLKLSSGQEAYHYQLFLEKEDKLTLPSVQQLFELSFMASNIKLKEVPSCLIIQMPRFGKNYKMYPRILPSQLLDVTDVIENSPRQCTICGLLATWECTQCLGQCGVGLESTAFCAACLDKAHAHNKRSTHSPRKLTVSQDFLILADHCAPPRLFMELFAVICIETSHYVAFVKCGVGQEAPWCFFDSMADRQGGQNGYNIPEMGACPDVSKWLSDEQSCRALHENAPSDKYLPEYARRLLCDAYICMYQSPDVMMYR